MDGRLDAGLFILVREGSGEAVHAVMLEPGTVFLRWSQWLENQQVDSLGQPAGALPGPSCLYLSVLGL